MDPLFREAKKRFLAAQPKEWQDAYYGRSKELNDGRHHYLEREGILNEEFEIDRERLTDILEDVKVEWKKKKAETKEAKQSLPPTPSPEERATPRGGFVPSNDVINVKWVADNLPVEDVDRESAPSTAAWGMLCWARKNPDQFYTQIFKQVVIPTKREIEEANDAADDEERLIEALDRVRKIAGEVANA
tara:strand:+ start:1171 stop:1737 length:567 start_codon:yes stop_codon:yes gene_type:complete